MSNTHDNIPNTIEAIQRLTSCAHAKVSCIEEIELLIYLGIIAYRVVEINEQNFKTYQEHNSTLDVVKEHFKHNFRMPH